MIGNKLYQKHNAQWFIGKKVRALVDLRNGHTAIPKGTVLTIRGKSSGFLLIGEPCAHCGIKVVISKVEPYNVAFVETEDSQ